MTQGGTLYAFPVAGCGGPSDCPPIWTAPDGADPAGKATGPIWLVQGTSVLGLDRATGQPAVELPLAGTALVFAVDGGRSTPPRQPGDKVGIEAFRDTVAGSSCTPAWRATVTGVGIGQPSSAAALYAAAATAARPACWRSTPWAAGRRPAIRSPACRSRTVACCHWANGRVYVTGAAAVTALAPAT